MVIESPSFTSAIGPPSKASGVTWPTTMPQVPPEKRPSVMSPRIRRALADERGVGASISRIPGPPFGPS
jgi:hypothetical protein